MLVPAKGQDARLKMTSGVFSQVNIDRLLTASDSYRSHPSHCNFNPRMLCTSVHPAARRTVEARPRTTGKEGRQH